MVFLYILKCKNNRFYIGSTVNISRRLEEHTTGESKYTREILPVELVFNQEFATLSQARKAEYWLKKQKSKQLIQKIIKEGKINKKF